MNVFTEWLAAYAAMLATGVTVCLIAGVVHLDRKQRPGRRH